MKTIKFGVLDIPYSSGNHETTGEVADFLEHKYGVMQAFVDRHKDQVQMAVLTWASNNLDRLANGMQPLPFALMDFSDLAAAFRRFLETAEIEKMGIPGVPTKAAQEGRNSRFKGKKNNGTGAARPSFIDTGAYARTMRVEGSD